MSAHPILPTQTAQDDDRWSRMLDLPCDVVVEVPVAKFTVGDLLRLNSQSLVNTGFAKGSEIPLRVCGQVVGWTEFEVIADRLAVRITELA